MATLIPGEILPADGEIELNVDRETRTVTVTNTGDRPIQVGSHYHFAETNPALSFDRDAARGFRLDIAAGTAVRFEPGQGRTVDLVALAGKRRVYGFRQAVMGALGRAGASAGHSSGAKQPAAKKPASKQPASKKPASKQPASKKPASKQPASKKPASKQPASKQPAEIPGATGRRAPRARKA